MIQKSEMLFQLQIQNQSVDNQSWKNLQTFIWLIQNESYYDSDIDYES